MSWLQNILGETPKKKKHVPIYERFDELEKENAKLRKAIEKLAEHHEMLAEVQLELHRVKQLVPYGEAEARERHECPAT